MKHLSTALKLAASLTTITISAAIPLSVSAMDSLLIDTIAQRTPTSKKPDTVETLEAEQAEDSSRNPSDSGDFQIEPRPTDPGELEATQTCDGFLACLDTLSFCDEVGGGMSTNPDGSMTCTY